MIRKSIVLFIILTCSLLLTACNRSTNTEIKINPTHLPMPSDKAELSHTLSYYRKIDKSTTHKKLMKLIESGGFKYRVAGGNDGDLFYISLDEDVIKQYDAKKGEYIEVYYPHLYETKSISDVPLYYVYHFEKNRCWIIIQQGKIGSYNPSYWGFKEPGVWVRQWPEIEGNKEYTSFMNADSAIQFVAHYKDL